LREFLRRLGATRTSRPAKQRENAVVDKFKGNLQRVCELDFEKKKLVCIENPKMATILAERVDRAFPGNTECLRRGGTQPEFSSQ
jgi:hypothetical protein